MNVVALVSYRGCGYQGFQAYLPQNSIQYYLEQAFGKVAGKRVKLTCAGRTDKGVHATYQVINFQTEAHRTPLSWQLGANSNLPKDIRVQHIVVLEDCEFSARFSAAKRCYRYVIYRGYASTLLGLVHSYSKRLEVAPMMEAARILLGEHDFGAFRSKDCNSHTSFRNVLKVGFFEVGNFVVFEICANAFLHNMVRLLMGSLLAVGNGSRDVDWFKMIFVGADRRQVATIAKPDGLYLVGVKYCEDFLPNPDEFVDLLPINIDFTW